MKTTIIAALLTGVCAMAAFAADSDTRSKGSGMSIEQKKVEVVQHIDERIANSQLEKACVQAAQSHDEIRTCRDTYRPKQKDDRSQRKE
jgi:hypothetical protein